MLNPMSKLVTKTRVLLFVSLQITITNILRITYAFYTLHVHMYACFSHFPILFIPVFRIPISISYSYFIVFGICVLSVNNVMLTQP